jgi:tetratricopeptide (TPR) repeat protein
MSKKILVPLAAAFLLSSCARKPEDSANAFIAAGDAQVAKGRYNAAVIEYRNAIKALPDAATAHTRLGHAFIAMAKTQEAYREFQSAAGLDPADAESRIEAGRLLLDAQMFEEAQIRAEQVLEKRPGNPQAIVLMARAIAASQQAQGDTDGAEAVLRGAVAQTPDSVEAHVALADFLWTWKRNADAAERELAATAQAHPSDELANRAMAAFFIGTQRAQEAEPFLKVAAAQPDQRHKSSIALADYYLTARRYDAAKPVLTAAVNDGAQGTAAQVRLAAIESEIGSPATARAQLTPLLQKNPSAEALALSAQLYLRDRRIDEAAQAARRALDTDPRLPAAHYVAGTVALDRGKLADAEHDLRAAMASPQLAGAARLQLARTKLAQGQAADAVALASTAGAAYDARITLAKALASDGQLQRARVELAQLSASYPAALEPAILLGTLDLEDGDVPSAQVQSQRALALRPSSVEALLLSAEAALAANDLAGAEQMLVRARTIDPSSFEAAMLHSQLLMNRRDFAGARAILEALARRQPNASAPRTAVAIVLEAEGRTNEARGWYEQAVALDPNDVRAANNLARIYAADPASADRAVRLAQSAVTALPDEAATHDTLGWAYYKVGNLTQASAQLERAVSLDPSNREVQSHLEEVKASLRQQ